MNQPMSTIYNPYNQRMGNYNPYLNTSNPILDTSRSLNTYQAPIPPSQFQNPNTYARQHSPTFPLKGILSSLQGVFIKQKYQPEEVLTGWEAANKYYVYEMGQDGYKTGSKLLKCKEYSGCYQRACCPADCRAFHMNCTNLFNMNSVSLKLIRDYQCTLCCLNRPEMQVIYSEEGVDMYFGKVVDNCDFCNYSFTIYDQSNRPLYVIEASCCQQGLLCGCPCQECQIVEFELYKGETGLRYPFKIIKNSPNCARSLAADVTNFSVPFPPEAGFQERVLLMASALMIDYMMFEQARRSFA